MTTKNCDTSKLSNFKSSFLRKYVNLGYHYSISNALIVAIALFLATVSTTRISSHSVLDLVRVSQEILKCNFVTFTLCVASLVLLGIVLINSRPRTVYLVDFACYKPDPECKISSELFMEMTTAVGICSEENLNFQKRMLERSGLGQETYVPRSLMGRAFNPMQKVSIEDVKNEAKMYVTAAIDELLCKTRVNTKDIGIFIVNNSLFHPTPSLSAMIINHYNLRDDISSFNLSAMGCSAGLISIDLAKHLLQVHANTYALVVSLENGSQYNWYLGNERSMLLGNCLFRLGVAAMLLSNQPSDCSRSKYELLHTVRTTKAAEDESYSCVYQKEDKNMVAGISLSRDLMAVAGKALQTNITTLGPLVLPMSEQLWFIATLVARKAMKMKIKPYVPNFMSAFEHFCIHPGGKAVLDEVEKSLKLSKWLMEPSRMALYRFGNTSSTAVWYALAYGEAKGRIKKGDRVWQIAFGSGFKCNSAVWRALKTINPAKEKNLWTDEIDNFPIPSTPNNISEISKNIHGYPIDS